MRSIKSVYERQFKTYKFSGIWSEVLGEPETNGAWLIWGAEKNGKTWFALMLAQMISTMVKTLYISAEEGLGKNFRESMKRAGIPADNRNLKVEEYIPLLELEDKLKSRKAPKVVFIDNLTIYNEEMKYGKFHDLLKQHRDKIFVFLAHEENRQPFTSTAKMCRKLAKVIVYVQGLKATIGGRCPGGELMIDETKAQLCWGTK